MVGPWSSPFGACVVSAVDEWVAGDWEALEVWAQANRPTLCLTTAEIVDLTFAVRVLRESGSVLKAEVADTLQALHDRARSRGEVAS